METVAGSAAAPAHGIAGGSKKPERGINIIEINGCPVEFPFEPYDCQKDYMGRVITALREGKNALLESPTGTGKTLCLLCSTLAWRESLRGPMAQAALAAQQQTAMPQQTLTSAVSSSSAVSGTNTTMRPAGLPLGTSGGKSSSWVENELGVSVDPSLANLPPALQMVLMAKGPAAPSATVASSSGSVGNAQGTTTMAASRLPTVVYASRTHSQLAQVIKELQRSSYRDRVRSTILSSRNQTCLHPKVSTLPQGAANQACRSLTSQKKCGWYNNLKYNSRMKNVAALMEPVPDLEDLLKVGRSHSLCAFYMSKEAAKEADVVFMPYNYLLDPNIRKSMVDQVNWENAIVIFDEAHNVEGVCSDSSSFDITSRHLTDAIAEARRCKEVCLEAQSSGSLYDPTQEAGPTNINYRQLYQDLDTLIGLIKTLETALAKLSQGMGKDGMTRPGSFLFEFMGQYRITDTTLPLINSTIDKTSDALQTHDLEKGGSGSKNACPALQHIQSCLNLAFSTLSPLSNRPNAPPAHKGYRVHIHLEKSWGADKMPTPTLSYWCFIPGMAMRMLTALMPRSILLTSGTLAPLDSFAAELQLPFEVTLENPHIVSPSQVWVGVLPAGPSGHQLCSTFKERENKDYKEDLGAAVINFARIVPDGLLVFFPSYGVLNSCIEYWKTNNSGGASTWERIIRFKAPVIEPRESSLFQQAIDDFKTKLDNPTTNGAVFFAVCRGKVSEGLDFSDRAGRGVIITGIPFAVATDPKVKLKRDVLDEERRALAAGGSGVGLSGEAWYLQQAMRAVNQAMGRVIRHRWDYGAVMLADKRFGDAGTQKALSKWLQKYVVVHQNFGSAVGSLTRFFKEKAGSGPGGAAGGGSGKPAGSAFQVVASTTSAAAKPNVKTGHTSKAAPAAAAGNLMDMVPSALDVSGFGGMLDASKPVKAKQQPSSKTAGGNQSLHSLLAQRQSEADSDRGNGSDVNYDAHSSHLQAAAARLQDNATNAQAEAGLKGVTAFSRLDSLLLGPDPTSAKSAGGSANTTAAKLAPSRPPPTTLQTRPASTRPTSGLPSVARRRAPVSVQYDDSNAEAQVPLQGVQHVAVDDLFADLDAGSLDLNTECDGKQPQPTAVTSQAVVMGPPSRLMKARLFDTHSARDHKEQSISEHGTGSKQPLLSSDQDNHAGMGQSSDMQTASVSPRQLEDNQGHDISQRQPVEDQKSKQAGDVSKRLGSTTDVFGLGVSHAAAARLSALQEQKNGKPGIARPASGKHGLQGDTSNRPGSATNHDRAPLSDVQPQPPPPQQQLSSKRPTPREFLDGLKAKLSPAVMEQVEALLKQYRSSHDAQKFMDGLITALKGSRTVHLLSGFSDFIPKQHRPWFTAVVDTHVQHAADKANGGVKTAGQNAQPAMKQQTIASSRGAAMASTGAGIKSASGTAQAGAGLGVPNPFKQPTALPVKREGQPPDVGVVKKTKVTNTAGLNNSVSEGMRCVMCGACPMDIAYSAPCGHTGCRSCWLQQIAQHFCCPTCKREVRQKSLTRKFFT